MTKKSHAGGRNKHINFYLFIPYLPMKVYKTHDLKVQLNCIAVQIIRKMYAN